MYVNFLGGNSILGIRITILGFEPPKKDPSNGNYPGTQPQWEEADMPTQKRKLKMEIFSGKFNTRNID